MWYGSLLASSARWKVFSAGGKTCDKEPGASSFKRGAGGPPGVLRILLRPA